MSIVDTKEIPLQLVVPLAASNRSFRLIELKNGIRCFLVSDPNDTTCACSVSVNSGSNNDPPELPGLAHFVEHTLFTGTKDYPGPNTFYRKISLVSGTTNAFTTFNETNFQFEIPVSSTITGELKESSFADILANFASFFKCPTFNSKCLNREIGLINEEHLANIESNDKIFYYCTKLLSNKQSAFHQFSTGNTETLSQWSRKQKIKLGLYLRNYFEDNYTCSNIKVVLKGPHSLNYLQKHAIASFLGILNHKISSNLEYPIFLPSDMGKLLWVKSSTSKTLRLTFPIKAINRESVFFIRLWVELLGNEAAGSICDFCSKEGLTTSIVVFEQKVSAFNSLVVFEADILSKGLARIDQLIVLVFTFIDVITKASIEQICQFMTDFLKLEAINSIYQEQFVESTEEIVQYSERMQDKTLDINQLLVGYNYYDASSFEVNYFQEMTKQCLNLNNINAIVLCDKFDPGSCTVGDSEWHHDRFYDFEYKELIIDKLKLYTSILDNDELKFPKQNCLLKAFEVPEILLTKKLNQRYHVKSNSNDTGMPILLKTEPHVESWFQKDPNSSNRIHMSFQIHIPTEMEPTVYIAINLICNLLGEYLLRDFYECETVGYQWGIWPLINSSSAICFMLSGLAVKYDYIVQLLLDKITYFLLNLNKIPYLSYTRSRVRLRKYYENLLNDDPFKKFMACVYWVVEENTYSLEDRYDALEEITFDQIQQIGSWFTQRVSRISTLILGDISIEEAIGLSNRINDNFLTDTLNVPGLYRTARSYCIPPRCHILEVDKNSDASNCLLYFDLGNREDKVTRVLQRVLDFIIQTTAVSELRIKRKLAYSVLTGQRIMRQTLGYFIYLSSHGFESRSLMEEVDDYLVRIAKKLHKMTNESFKTSILDPLLSSIGYDTRSANLVFDLEPIQQSTNFDPNGKSYKRHKGLWEKILNKTYRFNARDGQEEVELKLLASLTKAHFEEFFNEKVSPYSSHRAILAIISKDSENLHQTRSLSISTENGHSKANRHSIRQRISLDFDFFKRKTPKRTQLKSSAQDSRQLLCQLITDVKAFQQTCHSIND